MIRFHVNAALRVLDGFTGKPPAPSALSCTVDGEPFRPVVKDGGYYGFMGLTPGEHQVVLRGGRYQEEYVTVTGGESYQELLVTMKPGAGYPFGTAVTTLTVRVENKKGPLARQRVWLAVKNPRCELRIAQDVVKAGETAGRVFFPGSAKTMPVPGDLLLLDGAKSEVCRLTLLEEAAQFDAPFQFDHKRSCTLYPAQVYTANEMGLFRAVFRENMAVELLAEGESKSVTLMLEPGENQHTFVLGKK